MCSQFRNGMGGFLPRMTLLGRRSRSSKDARAAPFTFMTYVVVPDQRWRVETVYSARPPAS